jgi:PAS domain S-box-containing protein
VSLVVGHTVGTDGRGIAMASSLIDALGSEKGGLTLLKLLADNSFDSVLVTDASAKGRIVYANKAFKKLTGHDPADVVGKDPRILQGPGTDRKVIDRLAAAIKAGGRFEGRAVNYKKDGTPFIMNWRMFPLKDAGKIIAWVAIQREALSAG